MDDAELLDLSVPDNVLRPFLVASGSSTLKEALDNLIEIAKTYGGRSELAASRIIIPVLQLCQFKLYPLHQDLLFSSLKLLRNLCAGEIINQNLFVEQNGGRALSTIVRVMGPASGSDNGILRTLVQVLGNVSLGGEEHQLVIWRQFFPLGFLEIARVRSKESCDPLCMVLYTCSQGSDALHAELCADLGFEVVMEILRTATVAGFAEDWLKLLLSRICLEESSVFSTLFPMFFPQNHDSSMSRVDDFAAEQSFLLSALSEIKNERVGDIVVSNEFALCVLGILRNSVAIVDFTRKAKSNLPTGSVNVDVMGYSLTILRDICAYSTGSSTDELVSSGLIELLISLLRDLEPPEIIKKAMIRDEVSDFYKYCPYKGFRRDIIAIVGNSCYRRKNVQDKIRELDGIVLLLQHCVVDEENPFLREWGLWAVHNLLDGNAENVKLVSELELQGTMDVPELTEIGLKVEVDPRTRRAKLVNVS